MKTVLIGVVAAFALTSLPAVHAQENTSVKVDASRTTRRYMSPDEFDKFRAGYLLTNGQVIVFKQRVKKPYVQLSGGDDVRIYATSDHTFITDSGVRFEFRDDGDTLAINDFQKLPMAANVPLNGVMMARR